MEKLKPCPFCGGKVITERWASGGIMYMVITIVMNYEDKEDTK